MTQTDRMQVLLGAILLFAGSATVFGLGTEVTQNVPLALGSLAALGLALGTVLLGTSGSDRPV